MPKCYAKGLTATRSQRKCVFAKIFEVVRGTGLEPARLSPYAPQTYVSANSTTRATVAAICPEGFQGLCTAESLINYMET